MAQNIFVSFNFTNYQVTDKVKTMIEAWQQDMVGHIVHGQQNVLYNGPNAIKLQLNNIFEQCDMALFVIGDQAQNSPWLRYEVEQALMAEMPIFVTRIPNTQGFIPEQLQSEDCMKVSWSANELNACLGQVCVK